MRLRELGRLLLAAVGRRLERWGQAVLQRVEAQEARRAASEPPETHFASPLEQEAHTSGPPQHWTARIGHRGPPPDWIEKVRRGAPELLLPSEEVPFEWRLDQELRPREGARHEPDSGEPAQPQAARQQPEAPVSTSQPPAGRAPIAASERDRAGQPARRAPGLRRIVRKLLRRARPIDEPSRAREREAAAGPGESPPVPVLRVPVAAPARPRSEHGRAESEDRAAPALAVTGRPPEVRRGPEKGALLPRSPERRETATRSAEPWSPRHPNEGVVFETMRSARATSSAVHDRSSPAVVSRSTQPPRPLREEAPRAMVHPAPVRAEPRALVDASGRAAPESGRKTDTRSNVPANPWPRLPRQQGPTPIDACEALLRLEARLRRLDGEQRGKSWSA